MNKQTYAAVVPAAGIGARMQAELPKQYLPLAGATVIELSLAPLLNHPEIEQVVVVLAENDQWFNVLSCASHPKLTTAKGGAERADSVLSGLHSVAQADWVLVHDAARPCLTKLDIDLLIAHAREQQSGAILATQVRDTMKRCDESGQIIKTVAREHLWHALTPQGFPRKELMQSLQQGITQGRLITDEASAMELAGQPCAVIAGRGDNIKVTRPEDMAMAELFIKQLKNEGLA
ncbi:2-C-methyl-D-erythritol 4-phosphate cytidylyltransferase [Motilimonas eburnea]|uniref:2-C-methyl-D-erythritol 4-phosphate cytidylyltransferase n=1 Tax=Motilimonas eburnea TaxID=1737488 RepID=UPI001E4D728E|nr:2-C-methyl-D-erythritol 4-phosphate cytidylyltransferase [Motilimonas eburnea]MCE2571424.1 2-C-methyl-D-erythritol 4-phosphate cytidylyltransferase [Motilimonas eburnea]